MPPLSVPILATPFPIITIESSSCIIIPVTFKMVNFKGPWVSAPDSKKRFKEQTEVTVNGIRYKIKVVDDYELHWFRNITVGAFKTEVHESKGEINPSKSDTKPLGNDTNSSKSDAQPLQSETNPSKCETNPSKSETKPSKGDSKPLESEPNPSKSETQPLKSEPNILKRKTSNTTPSDIESSKPGKSPKTAHESSEESPGNMPLVNCENVSAEDDESESAGEEDDQFETTEEDDDESYSAEEDTDHVNDDFDYDSDESEEDAHAVGYVIARLMRRGLIANTFWEDMEEPSQDTSALGFDIFDRFGNFGTLVHCGLVFPLIIRTGTVDFGVSSLQERRKAQVSGERS